MQQSAAVHLPPLPLPETRYNICQNTGERPSGRTGERPSGRTSSGAQGAPEAGR
jgi:hypothetical protein